MSMKVAIRVRPFNEREKFLGCSLCVSMDGNCTSLIDFQKKSTKFNFDYCLWSHDGYQETPEGMYVGVGKQYVDQMKMYNMIGRQIIDNSCQGYNCCLLAYGQTGAGKSYSMIGYGVNRGIVPLACQELFDRIKQKEIKGKLQFEVYVSMLEIYNQKIQDLFISVNKRPTVGLKVRESKTLGIYVEGLTKFWAKSYKDLDKKMNEGSKNRSLASTSMNQYSSRAHTIVMVEVLQKQFVSPMKMNKKTSQIFLVDLAGSERVKKTKIESKDRLKEASQINKSLHTLGKVIEMLSEQSSGRVKNMQIPYRQSVLTRILQACLGGNSKTTMICAISPASDNYQQILATLRYADQTKKIKNKPVVNETELDKIIRQLREENQKLKDMLNKNNNMTAVTYGAEESQESIMEANIKEIQKEIRKNLQSFAINTDDMPQENSYFIDDYIDHEPTQFLSSQLSFDLENLSNCQAYITNLNQDQILNFKVKYSCNPFLTIGSKRNHGEGILVLCGLGIQQRHANIYKNQKDNLYYLQSLSQLASQYTFLNGEYVQVGHPQQLYHNDRIILGINCVFLFKHISKNVRKQAPNQKAISFEFTMAERQNHYADFSINNITNHSRMEQTLEMTQKLEQIEKQFEHLLQENQRKMKKKEEQYKKQLERMESQKKKQREQWELQLKAKQEQAQKLRKQKDQIQLLKIKLLEEKNQNLEKILTQVPKFKKIKRHQSLNYDIVSSPIQPQYITKYQTIHEVIQNTTQYHHHHFVNQQSSTRQTQPINQLSNKRNQFPINESHNINQHQPAKNDLTLSKNQNQINKLTDIKQQQKLDQVTYQNQLRSNTQANHNLFNPDVNKNQHSQHDSQSNSSCLKGTDQVQLNKHIYEKSIEQEQSLLSGISEAQDHNQSKEQVKKIIQSTKVGLNPQNNNKPNFVKSQIPEIINQLAQKQLEKQLEKLEHLNKSLSSPSYVNPRQSFMQISLDLSSDEQQENKQNKLTQKLQRQYNQRQKLLNNKINQLQNKLNNIEVRKSQLIAQRPSSIIQQQQNQICNNNMVRNSLTEMPQQLKDSMIKCNNENILNERMIQLRKKKKQTQQFRKILIKKQKIQLQKQMISLIPMIQKFNRMAIEMGRKIQASIQIDYKYYCHFEIIQALREKPFRSKIHINICIDNAQQNRSYRWTIETFKNRYELVQQMFGKFVEISQEDDQTKNSQDDPFWQPPILETVAFAYLSLECILYSIPFQGYIKFVSKGHVVAKLYTVVTSSKNQSISNYQILNPRSHLGQNLTFQIAFKQFEPLNVLKGSKFKVCFEILENDYQLKTNETSQMNFKKENMDFNYTHTFRNISQESLNYITDSPICFKLCILNELDQQLSNRIRNKSIPMTPEVKKSVEGMNQSGKKNEGLIFQNYDIISKLNEDVQKQQNLKKKEVKVINSQSKKKQNSQCTIY